MQKFMIGAAVMLALATVSCQRPKDEEVTPTESALPVVRVTNLAVQPSTGSFTLYSLKDNKQVANSDSATTKWDIGFRSTTLIFNAASRGPGAGGALMQTGIFSDFATAPTTGYRLDTSAVAPPVYAVIPSSGKGWYDYNATANTITPSAGKFIAVRTAEGKYAKLEILSYYKDAPATPDATSIARNYNFRFVYQPNGTKLK